MGRPLRIVAFALALVWILAGAVLLDVHTRVFLPQPMVQHNSPVRSPSTGEEAQRVPARLRRTADDHVACPCRGRFTPDVRWHHASSSLRARDQRCYIRAWSPAGAAAAILGANPERTKATKTKWLVFLGDSSLRGLVLSLICIETIQN